MDYIPWFNSHSAVDGQPRTRRGRDGDHGLVSLPSEDEEKESEEEAELTSGDDDESESDWTLYYY